MDPRKRMLEVSVVNTRVYFMCHKTLLEKLVTCFIFENPGYSGGPLFYKGSPHFGRFSVSGITKQGEHTMHQYTKIRGPYCTCSFLVFLNVLGKNVERIIFVG